MGRKHDKPHRGHHAKRVGPINRHAHDKTVTLHDMHRRATGWMTSPNSTVCPALPHLLRCYKSLHDIPIKETFGCDTQTAHSVPQWTEATPQLPQFASTTQTTDSAHKRHIFGWLYAVIGCFSSRAIYIGYTALPHLLRCNKSLHDMPIKDTFK